MKKLITIASFQNTHEAYISAGVLRENKIDSFLQNELSTQVYSLIKDQLGGIQLQVNEENAIHARQLLIENELIKESDSSDKDDFLLSELTTQIPLINKLPLPFQLVASLIAVLLIAFVMIVISFLFQ